MRYVSKKKDRDIAKELYLESKGEMPLIEIAEKLNKPPGTVRGWKSRYKWDNYLDGKHGKGSVTLQNKKRNATKNIVTNKNEEQAKDKVEKEILENNNLTDKQQLFCMYYLKYFNATKSYQKAYQVDYMTANAHGYKLLSNVVIKAEIERLKRARLEGIQLDSQAIVQKYIDIAFADITDFLSFGQKEITATDEMGTPLLDHEGNPMMKVINYVDFKNDNEVDGTIISEVSMGKDGIKVKLYDKMKALEWLSENLDLFPGAKSQLTKSRIESEKMKVKKLEVEIDNMTSDKDGQESEDWVNAIKEIAAKRKKESGKDG